MKPLFTFGVSVLSLLPISLFGQIETASTPFSVMRFSDLEMIEVASSYNFLQDNIYLNYVSPDGENYMVCMQNKPATGLSESLCSNYYYQSASGKLINAEVNKPLHRFVATEKGLLSFGKDVAVLDPTTFEPRWYHKRFRDIPFYIHYGTLLALGGGRGRFYGYDLATGEELWEVKISHEGGVSTVYALDEEHVLLVADDLVKLNTRTGAIQKFEIKNYILNGGKIAGQILVGVASAMAGVAMASATGYGYYYVPVGHGNLNFFNGSLFEITGESNTISHLSSNVLEVNHSYYLADRECVRCFDADLNIKWTASLPPRHASKSTLLMSGDTLWMVNNGFATFDGSRNSHTGYPFVAAFNAKNGEQLYYKEIGEKHAPVQEVLALENQVCYLFKDSCKLVYFDPNKEIVRFDDPQLKNLTLENHDTYIINAETRKFEPLSKKEVYLSNSNGDIFRLSPSEGLVLESTSAYVYQNRGTFADSLNVLLGGPNSSDCWLVNQQGETMYHVMSPVESVRVRTNNLFLINENSFAIFNKELLTPSASIEEH